MLDLVDKYCYVASDQLDLETYVEFYDSEKESDDRVVLLDAHGRRINAKIFRLELERFELSERQPRQDDLRLLESLNPGSISAHTSAMNKELYIEALDEAFPALLEVYGRSEGSELHYEPDCFWLRTRIDFPVYGGVYQARFTEENAERRIAEMLATIRARPEAACWFVSSKSTPHDLSERLMRAGLELKVDLTGMAIELNDLAAPPETPPGVEIKAVETEDGVRDYARLYPLLFGAEDNGFITDIEAAEVDSWRSGKDTTHRYVAYKSGKPVCAGATSRDGAIARLDTLCSLPEERNQGIGAALATMGFRREQADGADHAIIWAGPGAEKLYGRMGFEALCTGQVFSIC